MTATSRATCVGPRSDRNEEHRPQRPSSLEIRWRAVRAFVAIGSLCVVAGGIVAAVTGPTDFELGSWVAAYLVLVGGVAQIASGAGQALLSIEPPHDRLVRAEVVVWNLALISVLVGTLSAIPVVTTVGGALTAAVLVAFLYGTRRVHPSMALGAFLYRGLVIFVLLSAPVGLTLAWMRRG